MDRVAYFGCHTLMNHAIAHEEIERRGAFFIEENGRRLAQMTYSRANDTLVIIDHTEVDDSLAGQGVGRRLFDATVEWARATQTKLLATCPFASAQFARNPSSRDVLAG